jgi:DNA-binding NtrC family response regulator
VLASRAVDLVGLNRIVGSCPATAKLKATIEKVAAGKGTVLILGETGTGKELVAKAVHELSDRRSGPRVTLFCAEHMATLESDLFGHVKGAFTGAIEDRAGLFEDAKGGSLFLDEIGDLEHSAQTKLLRVLESRELKRMGSNKVVPVDVRVIAATNCDLEQLIKVGKFRQDLFYRLSVLPIRVLPLRERRQDIPELVAHFIEDFTREGLMKANVSGAAIELMIDYPWPGNVRELRAAIECGMTHALGGEMGLDLFPGVEAWASSSGGRSPGAPGPGTTGGSTTPSAKVPRNVLNRLLDALNGLMDNPESADKTPGGALRRYFASDDGRVLKAWGWKRLQQIGNGSGSVGVEIVAKELDDEQRRQGRAFDLRATLRDVLSRERSS